MYTNESMSVRISLKAGKVFKTMNEYKDILFRTHKSQQIKVI